MVVMEVELTDDEAGRLGEMAGEKQISVGELIHEIVVEGLLHPADPAMVEKRRPADPRHRPSLAAVAEHRRKAGL